MLTENDVNKIFEIKKQRSDQQRKALQVFCRLVADSLNEAGYDMRKVLKEEIEIPWTMDSVKTHLWKPIQKAMYDKESTTELNTEDPTKIHETLMQHLGKKLHIEYIPFPNKP